MTTRVSSVGCKYGRLQACIWSLLIMTPTLAAAETYEQIMDTRMKAITALAARAQELCAPMPAGTSNITSTELKAEASAKLAKTFQLIADAGAGIAVKRIAQTNQGVPQAALADLLKDRGNCPSNFVIKMAPLILVPPPSP